MKRLKAKLAEEWTTWFGMLFFVGMMATGYYYNLTFVQFGLLDLGTRLVGMSRQEVAGLVLLVVMAYTLILIPVTLLGFVAGFLAIGYGFTGIGLALGRWLRDWRGLDLSPGALAFLGTLVFVIAQNLLSLLPYVGSLIGLAFSVMALGAVVLTRFGLREFVPSYSDPERTQI